jgi:hypothetical protein
MSLGSGSSRPAVETPDAVVEAALTFYWGGSSVWGGARQIFDVGIVHSARRPSRENWRVTRWY